MGVRCLQPNLNPSPNPTLYKRAAPLHRLVAATPPTARACRDGYMRVQRSKLMYRVVFPFELKLGCAAAEGCDAADTPYSLFAVIVHVGSGLDHGTCYAVVTRVS